LTPEQRKYKVIRFFSAQGCCGPSVQMAITEDKLDTDEFFTKDDVRFSIDQEVKEMLQNVTLVFSGKGFRLEGFQSTGCC
jgi:Fe-S cluster assembly iron-binding protein IscA